jgi:hypothetical protein
VKRYIVRRDFYAGLSGVDSPDWAVYDTAHRKSEDRDWPLAVFAFCGDARAFARSLSPTRRPRPSGRSRR